MRIPRKIRNVITVFGFLARNAFAARRLASIESVQSDLYIVRGLKPQDLENVDRLYRTLHDGRALARPKMILLRLFGGKLGFGVFSKETSGLVGVGVYYFNAREVKEHTVHEGFTGLEPSFQGKGLGSWLRGVAIAHFEKNGLSGVSSRVSENNIPSLKSNERLGFEVIERYYDGSVNEERFYLVKKFRGNDDLRSNAS